MTSSKNMRFRPILFSAFLFVFCVSAFAQTPDPLAFFDEHKRWYNGPGEPWFYFFDIAKADVRRSIEKWVEINRSLESAGRGDGGHFWSGGFTHGTVVRWSKDKGYIWLDVDLCQGGPMRIVHGRVEKTPVGLTLIPELKLGVGHSDHASHASHAERIEFVSVDWRGAKYLVRKNNVADFAD